MWTKAMALVVLPLALDTLSANDCTGGGGTTPDAGTTADASAPDAGQPAPDASTTPDAGQPDTGAPAGPIKTIFLIVMENHNWSDIVGSASAPYLNSLLPQASYCSNYFDNPKAVHPSEPNYLWLEGGDNFGVTDDNDPSTNHQATTDHLVTLLSKTGVSWRSYQEDMTPGTCPVTSVNKYAPKHNPMVFFDDVVGNPPSSTNAGCIANVRPYAELAGDLTNGTVARYNFITPNLCDDMHDSLGCPTLDSVKNGDTWLAAELPKILGSAAYKDNGAVFITWDESEGGEVPIGMIVLSPKAKGHGYVSATKYYHSSMLRTVQEVFGATPLLRDAANQPSLSDLFTSYP
jgi:hypothetical protein